MPASDNSSLCSLMYHPSGAFRRDPVGPEGTGSHRRPGLRYGLKADGLRAARPSRRLRTADGCDDSSLKGHASATETADYPHLRTFTNRHLPSGQKVTSRAGNGGRTGRHSPHRPTTPGTGCRHPATDRLLLVPAGYSSLDIGKISRRIMASRNESGYIRRGSYVVRRSYV